LLADVQRLRGQMFAPCKAFNFGGKDNTYAEVALEQPTFVDQLKIMQAATIAVDRSLKIAVHDTDSSANLAAVDQWLTHVTESGTPDAG